MDMHCDTDFYQLHSIAKQGDDVLAIGSVRPFPFDCTLSIEFVESIHELGLVAASACPLSIKTTML